MIIDCISDLHGSFPKLEGGDLLIVAGDLTARHTSQELKQFLDWFESQKYDRLVFIGGNHDEQLINWFTTEQSENMMSNHEFHKWEYLCDSSTEFEGLKIWGSPWSLAFDGMNPSCKAFTGTEAELKAKFELIPDDIDILVTHSPPYGILDQMKRPSGRCEIDGSAGSKELLKQVFEIRPKLHVFGHIHEGHGKYMHMHDALELGFENISPITFVNASHMNEHYEPVNKPIRIVL